MPCDAVTNYCLAFFVYQGAKSMEDKDAIQKCGLVHTVVMKLLKMGNYICKGYYISSDNFFYDSLNCRRLKLSTYVIETIRRNGFLPQAFRGKFEIGKKKYFCKGPILAAAFRGGGEFLCFSSPPTARQKILNAFVYVRVNKNRLQSLPLHRATVTLCGVLTHRMLCCTCILTKGEL
jgi:hypothetical protein